MNRNFNDNIGLVKYVADKLYTRIKNINPNTYLEKEDLIQEGLIGLYKATKLYNPKKYTKFSTYAYKAIHNELYKYINKIAGYKNNLIIKPDTLKLCNKISKYIDENENNSVNDICNEFKIPKNKVDKLLNIIAEFKIAQINVNDCEDYLYNKKSNYLHDIGLTQDINKLLECLNKRERDIVELYYGLGSPKTCYELIGVLYGCSKQRINEVIKRALSKLKSSANKNLKEYLLDYN